jgi:hypothetical protein
MILIVFYFHSCSTYFYIELYSKKKIIDIDSCKWITKESAFELLSGVKLCDDRVGPLAYIGYLSQSTPLPNTLANSQLLYQV